MTTTEPVSREPRALTGTEDGTADAEALPVDVVVEVAQVEPARVEPAGTKAAQPRPAGRYVPGLDGMRGVAVAAMLLYHHGFTFVPGGMLGVSTFFTLSGFLIATVVLGEHARTGRVSLPKFFEQRARRLVPPALAAVVLVVGLQYLFAVGSGPRFRGDLLAGVGYVTNWRQAASGSGYGALFRSEAPTQHFWSLAIEAQFYVAFPLLLLGALWLGRKRLGVAGVLLAVAAGSSFGAAWASANAHGNTGITYYATYTRAGEILSGVALALIVATAPVKRLLDSRSGVVTTAVLGVAGVVGWLWLWHTVALSDPALFHGGVELNVLFTGLVILACLSRRAGPAVTALSVAPVRDFGKVSYGVYLYHWPLFLFLTTELTGLGSWPLFALRVAATLAVAVVSYHYLESPVRFRMRMPRLRLAAGMAVAAAVVVALVLAVPVHDTDEVDLAAAQAATSDMALVEDRVVPEHAAASTPKILLVGDSVVWSTLPGYEQWNAAHASQVHVDAYFSVACTIGEPASVRSLGVVEEPNETCTRFRADLPATLARADYDAIVVMMGHKDMSERQLGGQWRHLGDPVFDTWMGPQVDSLADILATEGAPVLWMQLPQLRIARANDPTSHWDLYLDNDPARIARLNQIVSEELEGRPTFSFVDLPGWLRTQPGGEVGTGTRPDGVHFSARGAARFSDWLVPQILELAGRRSS
jgi:peptidoglycan/LPS O-acetylase OafA/YrhL/lysophospholipase L1-like esterase